MNRQTTESILGTAAALFLATLVAIAGSDGSARVGSVSLFALCAVIAFVIQWLAFVPAYLGQTERFYDLVGSLTYLTVVACALSLSGHLDARAVLLGGMVAIWAVRLGQFLFRRVHADGFDRRFNRIKTDAARFFMTWTLQGLWVFLTLAAALAALSSAGREPLGWVAAIGFAMWCSGFVIEVIADRQKRTFRADPENQERFISSGLWAWSRHPNYFGEVLLWSGVTVVALPVLSGWQWVTLISPVFVFILLTRVSGTPMLEARANKQWGNDADYQAYKSRTPAFMLRPPG